jgi:LytS/YehU family sensor histidine kinase
MRYPVKIKFESNENIEQIEVPPMLLVPFVENIFKHGIDKTEVNNNAELKLQVRNNTLTFTTINSTFDTKQSPTPGTGLENLERRLKLLFDKNYRISVGQQEGFYKAELQIPVA